MTRVIVIVILACLLAACAPGGGIGLEALMQDRACQQSGYAIGTQEYAQCRIALHQQSIQQNQQLQAGYAAAIEAYRRNQPQTCTYNGTNMGGIVSGTSTCQ
jgi:hypothetical protein